MGSDTNTSESIGKAEKLTTIQQWIIQEIKKGKKSNEIALSRGCSVRTVEKHRSQIIKKLNLKGEANAIIRWVYSSDGDNKRNDK